MASTFTQDQSDTLVTAMLGSDFEIALSTYLAARKKTLVLGWKKRWITLDLVNTPDGSVAGRLFKISEFGEHRAIAETTEDVEHFNAFVTQQGARFVVGRSVAHKDFARVQAVFDAGIEGRACNVLSTHRGYYNHYRSYAEYKALQENGQWPPRLHKMK